MDQHVDRKMAENHETLPWRAAGVSRLVGTNVSDAVILVGLVQALRETHWAGTVPRRSSCLRAYETDHQPGGLRPPLAKIRNSAHALWHPQSIPGRGSFQRRRTGSSKLCS